MFKNLKDIVDLIGNGKFSENIRKLVDLFANGLAMSEVLFAAFVALGNDKPIVHKVDASEVDSIEELMAYLKTVNPDLDVDAIFTPELKAALLAAGIPMTDAEQDDNAVKDNNPAARFTQVMTSKNSS